MKVEILKNGLDVRLLESLVFKTSFGSLIAPIGFETDFASVPRIFWNIIPPWGKHGRAAVAHDYLYRTSTNREFTREEADEIFLDEMKKSGVGYIKRYTMYWVVRSFGSFSWIEENS